VALLGKNLQILKPVSGGYSPIIAAARSCEINIDGDQLEVSSPNDGKWRNYIAGRNGWSISVGYLMSVGTFPTEAAMVNTTVTIVVSDGPASTDVEVPYVVGHDVTSAQAAIEAVGLTCNITYTTDSAAAGTVLSCSPGEGTLVGAGETITVVVSDGTG
jgi:hypothetical protein